jgi:uncharacterized protein
MLERIKGLDFPIRFTAVGNLKTVSGTDKLVANLKSIVTTSVNQRVMRPTFGVPSEDLLFSKAEAVSTVEVRSDIMEAIGLFEPRVVLQSVTVNREADDSAFIINISFSTKALGFQSMTTFSVSV